MKKNLLFSLWLTILTMFSASVFGQNVDILNCTAGTISNNQMVFTTTNFTIIHKKGNSTSFASYSPWRVYIDNTVDFLGNDDVLKINSIVITADTEAYATAVNNSIFSEEVNKSINGKIITIIPVTDIKNIQIKPTSQTRWQKIEINYEKIPSNTPPTLSNKSIPGTYGVALTDGEVPFIGTVESWFEPTGSIPQGITFSNGVFSGTPTQAGTFVAYVKANNQYGDSNEATVTFDIDKASQTLAENLENITGFIGESYTQLPSQTQEGKTIVYTSNFPIVEVDGTTLNFISAGTAIITATATGDSHFEDFENTFEVNIIDPNAIPCFEEDFSTATTGNYTSTSGSNSQWTKTDKFSSSANVYQAGGTIRLGSSSAKGSLTTIELTQFENKTVKVRFDAKSWSTNAGSISLNLGDQTKDISLPATTLAADLVPYEVIFPNVEANDKLTISSGTTSEKRFFLDNLSICVVTNTIWNGTTWSNGEPTSSVNAIIAGNLEITSDLNTKSITVEPTGAVTVKSGATLTVEDAVINNTTADKFVVEAGGNLVQVNTNVTNIGQVTVYQNSREMVRNDMTIWSSPVAGVNVRNFSPETLEKRFWTYDESQSLYVPLFVDSSNPNSLNLNPSTYTFPKGSGIAIRSPFTLGETNSEVYNGAFIGELHNGNVEVGVTSSLGGYNLVGNPYASSIDVEDFLTANSGVNTLYFWTHTYPVGSAQYNQNYAAFSRAGSVTSPDIESIAVAQGFFVKVNPGTSEVSFDNGMRTNTNPFFYRNPSEKNRYWLSLSKGTEKMNQILVAYMTDATNNEDAQIDARLMNKEGNVIYTILDQNAFAIQGRELPFNSADVVKLGFNALEEGDFTIKLEAKDGFFSNDQEVYLIDHLTNTTHNLTENPYAFRANAGVNDTRFEIVYQNRTLATDEVVAKNKVNVVTSKSDVRVISNQTEIAEVSIYDIQGKVLYQQNHIKQLNVSIPFTAKGVYVVKVKTVDGKVISQKIIK